MADKNEVDIKANSSLVIKNITFIPGTMSAPSGTKAPTITRKSDTHWLIMLECDRKGSATHAEFFNTHCGGYYHEYTGKGWGFDSEPRELNFCFAVSITFTYKDGSATKDAISRVVYLAQGHYIQGIIPRNNWWIGGEQTVANGNGSPLLLAESAQNTVAMSIDAGHSDFNLAFKYKTKDITLPSWMSKLGGGTSLAKISMPGTHDSCSRFGGIWTETQKRILNEQFDDGVRFIDIRCRHYKDRFEIHHGSSFQNLNFQQVMDMCFAFLNKNTSETIVMSIKEEYDAADNNRTFAQTFMWYLETNNCVDRWYLKDTMPTLDAVRGKIVLFRRFDEIGGPSVNGLKARPWQENTTFSISNTVRMEIQDHWKTVLGFGLPEKWRDIKALLAAAKAASNDSLYVNFCSAWSILTPKACADYVNPQLTDYFIANTAGRFGAVLMDFETADLNRLLIATNFP